MEPTTETPADLVLVAMARHGDAAAWEALVRQHQAAVFRLAYLILGDANDAEDVAQETFLRAYRALHSFDPDRPLRPWLLSISANLARNQRRSLGRYWAALGRWFSAEPGRAAGVTPALEEHSDQRHTAHSLWQAVQRLSQSEQEIIYLRYFLEMPVAEVAAALNVAEGTVKSRLHRALEHLRGVVARDFPALDEGLEA